MLCIAVAKRIVRNGLSYKYIALHLGVIQILWQNALPLREVGRTLYGSHGGVIDMLIEGILLFHKRRWSGQSTRRKAIWWIDECLALGAEKRKAVNEWQPGEC